MMITEVELTIGGESRLCAEHCPSSLTVDKFLHGLVRGLLETPHSQRLVAVPGIAESTDKADVTGINITVTR